MDNYTVRIVPRALAQIADIKGYISASLQSPETAEKWLNQMEEEIASLSFMPAKYPLTEEEPWHSQGIHKMVVGNHLVYYWIEVAKLYVHVIAVTYGRQDQKRQLAMADSDNPID